MMNKNICLNLCKVSGIHPDKNLGQNFLINQQVIEDIVDSVEAGPEDTVVEIGCGIGALTYELCAEAGQLIGIELDKRVLPALESRLSEYNNYKIINQDVLEADFSSFGPKIKVVGNLPYYITTEIMKRLFTYHEYISDITVMMQTEVANKVVAKPGQDGYGLMSIMAANYGEVEVVTNVDGSNFFPPAPVQSTVLHIRILDKPRAVTSDEQHLFRFIKDALLLRRKTLLNSLAAAGYFGGDKAQIQEAIVKAGVEPSARAEKLTLQQLADLAEVFKK
ncbi:MAG: ribosomal RNA small subunit methyltransferase A [Clostridia bacterium]|nr:ribosomal RNA small subunit methyltransferase A [Clostridia bacterium]